MRAPLVPLLLLLLLALLCPRVARAQEEPAAPEGLEVAGNRIRVYGMLRLDVLWSDSRLNHPQFPMWALSEPAGSDDHVDVHPRLSRFGVGVERDSLPFWPCARAKGMLEIDFQNRAVDEPKGGSESRQMVRLRHAFLELGVGPFAILAGQTWDLVAPLYPAVNADGMMWNAGNLGDRRPQVRASFLPGAGASGPKLQVQAAIARTGAVDLKDLDADGVRDGDDAALPMVQGRIGLASIAGAIDVGVWGHWAREETSSVPSQPGTDPPEPVTSGGTRRTSLGIGADLAAKLGPVTLRAEGFWGQNLSDLRGGIGQGAGRRDGEEIEARGGWAEARLAVAPWLAAGAGASIDEATSHLVDGDRRRNWTIFGNAEVDAGGGIVSGIDFIHFKTEHVAVEDGDANRFDLYAAYRF